MVKKDLFSFRRCFQGEGIRGFKFSPLCQCSAAESLMLEGVTSSAPIAGTPCDWTNPLFRVLCFTVMPWNESCSKWLRKHQWCLRNSGPSLSMVREGRSKLSIDAVSPFSSSCLKKKRFTFFFEYLVYVYTYHMPSETHGGQKRILNFLELELQMVLSNHVDTGNNVCALWKSTQLLLNCLFSSFYFCFYIMWWVTG